MTDEEKYIYSYLNSKSTTLSFYVSRILNGSIAKSEYFSCVGRILSLIDEVKKIIVSVEIEQIPMNSFFNELFLLKDYDIFEITNMLDSYHYKDVLDNCYKSLKTTVNEKKRMLPDSEVYISFIINNHMVEDEDIFEYFLKAALNRTNKLDYDTFETLFVDYTLMRMKAYVPNPKCFVVSAQKLQGRKAYSYQDKIYLCREEIQKLHALGVYAVIKNMFHELGHVKQYKDIKLDQKDDEFTLKQIKEEILSSLCSGYYNENYSKISYEIEAEFMAITELLKLLAKFDMHFKNNVNPYTDVLGNLLSLINDNERIRNKEAYTVDEIFDNVIMYHPYLLDEYPQLQKKYEVGSDDIVVRKDDFGRKD